MSIGTTDLLRTSLKSQNCSDEEANLFIDIITTIKTYSVDDNFNENVRADVQDKISRFVGEHTDAI